jgi:hypothetical protein
MAWRFRKFHESCPASVGADLLATAPRFDGGERSGGAVGARPAGMLGDRERYDFAVLGLSVPPSRLQLEEVPIETSPIIVGWTST